MMRRGRRSLASGDRGGCGLGAWGLGVLGMQVDDDRRIIQVGVSHERGWFKWRKTFLSEWTAKGD